MSMLCVLPFSLRFVLNASTLTRCCFLYYPPITCKHKGRNAIVMHTSVCFRPRSVCAQRKHANALPFLILSAPNVQAQRADNIRKHPHLYEGVCVGRSYRNRTYTVGVRGPSATTTPSSIALAIIYH